MGTEPRAPERRAAQDLADDPANPACSRPRLQLYVFQVFGTNPAIPRP
ncbi:MAG: hypothetical protein ACRED1_07355 [Limisphaerales bacterium]